MFTWIYTEAKKKKQIEEVLYRYQGCISFLNGFNVYALELTSSLCETEKLEIMVDLVTV